MLSSSEVRDQPSAMARWAYHSRAPLSASLVNKVTMWNHGNLAAACCPNVCRGHLLAHPPNTARVG